MLTSDFYCSKGVFCNEFEGPCHFRVTLPGSPCREFTFSKKGGDCVTASETVEGRECCRLLFSKKGSNFVDMVICIVFTSTKSNPNIYCWTDISKFAEFSCEDDNNVSVNSPHKTG